MRWILDQLDNLANFVKLAYFAIKIQIAPASESPYKVSLQPLWNMRKPLRFL